MSTETGVEARSRENYALSALQCLIAAGQITGTTRLSHNMHCVGIGKGSTRWARLDGSSSGCLLRFSAGQVASCLENEGLLDAVSNAPVPSAPFQKRAEGTRRS